jgi:hypothetical protein
MQLPEEKKELAGHERLPQDVWFLVFACMTIGDVVTLAVVSRFFRSLIVVRGNQYWVAQHFKLPADQKLKIPSEHYRETMFARHYLKDNLRGRLVPVVGISLFGVAPIPVSKSNNFFSSIKSALPSAIVNTNVPVTNKFHLTKDNETIVIDLDELTKIIVSDDADCFIVSVSRFRELLPFLKDDRDQYGLSEKIKQFDAAAQRKGQDLKLYDVVFLSVLLEALLGTGALNCFRAGLKIFIGFVVLNFLSMEPRYKKITNKVFSYQNDSFKREFLKIISGCGDEKVIGYSLNYLIDCNKNEINKLFYSDHELFYQVFLSYHTSLRPQADLYNSYAFPVEVVPVENVLARRYKIISFVIQTNEDALKIRFFSSISKSENVCSLLFTLRHVVETFRDDFVRCFKDNIEFFSSFFEKHFEVIKKDTELCSFILSLNSQAKYILEHQYNLEKNALSHLLETSGLQVRLGEVSLPELQTKINVQFSKVQECQDKLDSLRANREIPKDQNTTNNPTLSMSNK